MSCSTYNKHASSSSGGTLRELSQKKGWRESLGCWTTVGLFVSVALGSTLPAVALAASISGVKFNDLNGNGVQNAGEKGLANEIVNLRRFDGSFKSITTDLNGNYAFKDLEASSYTIWSGVYPSDPTIAGDADWQQTTPEEGEFPRDHTVTLSGANNTVVNFGVWNGVEVNFDFVVDAGGNHAIDIGEKVDHRGAIFDDANAGGKHTVIWDFGDGNSKKQIVSATTRSSGVKRAVRAANTPIQANNTPVQTGTLTTTVTVEAANGKTATDTATTIVRNNRTDPCAVGVPTVQSIKSGDWSDPSTWSTASAPSATDWVIISAGTTVTLKEPPITDPTTQAYPVRGLCVAKNATLTSASNSYRQPVTWVAIQATNIHNQGTIKGANGLDGIDSDGQGPNPFQHATGGSKILLRCNQLINDGTIIAGSGGKDSTWTFMNDDWATNAIGGAGGTVELYPNKITNNGLIQGGNGGLADRCNDSVTLCVHGNGIGGQGGLVRVAAIDMSASSNSSTGQVLGGRGGDAEIWVNGSHGAAGAGGSVEANFGDNQGKIAGGGPGSTVRVDPSSLTFGSTTRIDDADNIVIFGGEDWTMELHNLSEGAISATKSITIAVGKGGIVDFRGSAANALKAAEKIEIFADTIVLDDGVALQQLAQTPNLVTGPAKILYHVAWSGVENIVAEPGETIPVVMTILNGGPAVDTYTLSMTHSASEFAVSEIPMDATVNSQRRTEIEFEVTVPETRGLEDVITITATSQSDSSVKAVAEIHVAVKPAEVVTPPPGPYSASGIIKDKLGPVAGVTVQIADQTATTDASGYWEITGLTAGNYIAEATKDGYLSFIQQFDVSEAMPTAKVPLKLASLLKLQVSIQPKVAKPGDDVTYLLSVTNNGDRAATGLILQDLIPEGTSLVSLTGENCDSATVTCSVSELAAGQTMKVKLVVNAPEVGILENTATVTANDYPSEVNVSTKEIVPPLSVLTTCTPNPVPMLESLHCSATVSLSATASETATGVKVITTLPTGVTLQAATPSVGTCDTSNLPTVTCQLNDLSNGHQATVEMDLTLVDAGLLVLTQETSVSANNYGTHSAKTRTNIFVPAEIQVDLALVIDITGSMQGEIDSAKAALKKFMATVDPNASPLMVLIAFKDEVTVKAFTEDMNVLLKAVDSLKAEGGGTCPEASVEAVGKAALHVKSGGQIWFSTDASPYPDADVQSVLDLLQSKNIRLHATVTGDCANSDSENGFAQAVNQ